MAIFFLTAQLCYPPKLKVKEKNKHKYTEELALYPTPKDLLPAWITKATGVHGNSLCSLLHRLCMWQSTMQPVLGLLVSC